MRGLEKDRARRYQQMAQLERDVDRLLAGDVDAGLGEGVAGVQARPPRPRWPIHLGVAAIFAAGIGTAVLLARTRPEVEKPALAVPRVLAPRVAAPPPRVTPPPPPAAALPAVATPGERVRRASKGHAARPASVGIEPPPTARKSKADDKIAPSPYTAPQVP